MERMFASAKGLLKLTSQTLQNTMKFHALPSSIVSNHTVKPISNPWSFDTVRTIVKNYFPRPNEYKRLKKHGWRVKLQTKNGRRQIMRRILKGRFYLTH